MSFFKRNRNDPLIPPVAPTPSQQARAATADPYAAKPGGGQDPYAAGVGGGDPYSRFKSAGQDASNPYARKGGVDPAAEAARSELFAGFTKPEVPAQPERKWGYEGREQEEDFDEDEEVEGIKQEMRGIKQDSLASTRNALRLAREAEDTARGTVGKLADQSERIANSERYLDMAKANSQRAEDKAEELRQLNRSIFKPVIVWNKDAKRAAEEQKIQNRHLMERADRHKALADVQDTRRRLGGAANPSPYGTEQRMPKPGEQQARKDARARYQFEATASDDELEDELDENLDETLEVTRRLKSLATAMGDEVTGQNRRLGTITDKTENLEFDVIKNTEKLKRIR